MGLIVRTIGRLPTDYQRDYYVYLLDYGWHEPLEKALKDNFEHMASLASQENAVVLMGISGSEFSDEVLSWHHVNGNKADKLLPAILITTKHPRFFQEAEKSKKRKQTEHWRKESILLIPLRDHCKDATDVVNLIAKIFADIRDQKALRDFRIAKEMRAGVGHALINALVLEPNVGGVGLDLKKMAEVFKK